MLEKDIEKNLRKGIESLGGLCLKFVSPGQRGVPDRVVILPGGKVIFVETKTKDGRLSKQQTEMLDRLTKLRAEWAVISSLEQLGSFLTDCREEMEHGI